MAEQFVTSQPPPPSSPVPPVTPVSRIRGQGPFQRPWYLVAALVLLWFIGVQNVMTGCSTLAYLREGKVSEPPALVDLAKPGEDPMQYIAVVQEAARLPALAQLATVTFPLNTAKLLLGALLITACGFAMASRPGARVFALQALAANAALAILEYALTQKARGEWIEAVVRATETIPNPAPEHAPLRNRAIWWWLERLRFGLFDIAPYAVAAFVLLRAKTKGFFDDAAARAALHARQRNDDDDL